MKAKTASWILGMALAASGCDKGGGGAATAAPASSAPAIGSSTGATAASAAGDETKAREGSGQKVAEERPASSVDVAGSAPEPAPSTSPGPATPSPSSKFAAQPYADGDVLKVMPSDCMGRAYIHIGALAADVDPTALSQAFENIMLGLVGRRGDADDARMVKDTLKLLQDGGVDPVKIREAAVCFTKRGRDQVLALGWDLSASSDPLAVIDKAIAASKGRKEKPIVERDGIRYIDLGDPIAQPAPNVLAFLQNDDALPRLVGGGAAAFAEGVKQLAWFEVRPDVDEHFSFSAKDEGGTLALRMATLPDGRRGRQLKDKPDEVVQQMNGFVAELAKRLDATSLKALADKLKLVKFAVEGGELVATLALPRPDLAALVKTLAAAKVEDLEKVLDDRPRDRAVKPSPVQ